MHDHTKDRHSSHGRIRRIAGWIAVVAGAAMVILPGPGLLSIALGVILLGRREPTLRRWSVSLRIALKRMSRSKQRIVCFVGWFLRNRHRQSRLFIREQLHLHANGQPFSPVVQVSIGLAVLGTLISIGAGAAMLITQ